MAQTQQLEKQIQTIESLRDVIHSMRSLAATYLNRSEERLDGMRAYAQTVGWAIADCLAGRDIRLPDAEEGGGVVLAFFSEQGLCGRFNEVMAEAAQAHAREDGGMRFVAVGRRGVGLLRHSGLNLLDALPSTTSPDGTDAIIHRIVRTVLGLYEKRAFRRLYLLYARYRSPGRIEPRFERALPLDLSPWRERTGARTSPPRLGLGRIALLRRLVDEYTFISLFQAMTESLASENGMRLQSMEAARSNIDESLEDLRMRARIARQNEITEELLDVVAGAEALRAQ